MLFKKLLRADLSTLTSQLDYVLAAAGDLKRFLLSDSIHWNLGTQQSLSLGGLLLAFHDLRALDMTEETAPRLSEARAEIDKMKTRWKTAWQAKAQQELRSRLHLWKAYIQDLSDGSNSGGSYPADARNRAIADMLLEATGGETGEWQALDEWLKGHFRPGQFIWHEALIALYPQERFWYLYGAIKSSKKLNATD
jgi:hypothetical protein